MISCCHRFNEPQRMANSSCQGGRMKFMESPAAEQERDQQHPGKGAGNQAAGDDLAPQWVCAQTAVTTDMGPNSLSDITRKRFKRREL